MRLISILALNPLASTSSVFGDEHADAEAISKVIVAVSSLNGPFNTVVSDHSNGAGCHLSASGSCGPRR